MIRKEIETPEVDAQQSQPKKLKSSHNLVEEKTEVQNSSTINQSKQVIQKEQESIKEEQTIVDKVQGEQVSPENNQTTAADDTQKQTTPPENNQIIYMDNTQKQIMEEQNEEKISTHLQEQKDEQKISIYQENSQNLEEQGEEKILNHLVEQKSEEKIFAIQNVKYENLEDNIDFQTPDSDAFFHSNSDSDSGKEAKEISKEELNARRMAVFDTLSNLQMDRYECFRRASFQKSKMARVMKFVLRQSVNERMIISMQGIAKLFVGELIECARKVCMDREETGPLKPSHIHAAYQILFREGKIPTLQQTKKLF